MRLMETKTAMSVRAKVARAASGATMMIAATTMAAMFHVVPTMAQQNTMAEMGNPQSVLTTVQSVPAVPVVSLAEPVPMPAPAPRPEPAPQSVQAPPAPPATAAAPASPSAPAASPASNEIDLTTEKEGISIRTERDANGKAYLIVNGVRRELTPEERRRLNKEIAIAQKEIAEATAKINSPEFKNK